MKKGVTAFLMAGMFILFAACGIATPGSTQTGSEKAIVPTEQKTKNLVYWSTWNSTEPQAIVLQEQIEKWEQKTGHRVEIQWKGRDIHTVVRPALEAKEKIDLFDDDFKKGTMDLQGLVLDMNGLAEKSGYEDYCIKAFPNAVRGWAGGKLLCVAYQPYTSGIFYNKMAFEAAGVKEEPKDWKAFLNVCEQLKMAGYEPLVLDDIYAEYAFGYHLARYLGQDAVKELSLNGGWSKSEFVIKAAQDILDLKSNGYLSVDTPSTFPAGQNKIGRQEAAMVVGTSWLPAEVRANTGYDLQWGAFNYPCVEGGSDPNTVANAGAQGFFIPIYSENAQVAWDLILYLTSGEADRTLAAVTESMPVDTRNTEWPEQIADCRNAFYQLTNVYDWNAGLTENVELSVAIKQICLKLYAGQVDAVGFAAELDELYKTS